MMNIDMIKELSPMYKIGQNIMLNNRTAGCVTTAAQKLECITANFAVEPGFLVGKKGAGNWDEVIEEGKGLDWQQPH